MQKLFNQTGNMVDEAIDGFVKCYSGLVSFAGHKRALKYLPAPLAGKVGIVSGGGAGHDPAFMGYIGENMLDAVAIGDIFSPPSADAFYAAFKAADAGKGVVCLYGNYPADTESVDKAVDRAAGEGIEVKCVIINDDVAHQERARRRGSTGEVLSWKIGGAAAALGYSQDEIVAVSQKALENMRSIGIGLASCIIPEEGRPNYLIQPGTMEIGVGHHGQSSMDTCKLKSADATADIMLDMIGKDLSLRAQDRVAVVIAGLGNTMLSELHIVCARVCDVMAQAEVGIHRSYVGNFFTSLDMMGITLTLLRLDDELIRLLDYPAYPVSLKYFS